VRVFSLLPVLVGLTLAAPPASAHDFNPGALGLVETAPGRFEVAWSAPIDSGAAPGGTRVSFPSHCRLVERVLDCGASGLHGTVRFEGMRERRMQVLVAVRRLDGSLQEAIVTGADPRLELRRRPASAALAWTLVGGEHILLGFDHLAFLIGLMLLVTRRSTLIATVTAFTLAHSVTLLSSTLGWVRLPVPAVEAAIGASVVLVAREALHGEPTLARRAPWIVALAFGLVHGLGFASALEGLGLPSRGLGFRLLFFNVGVELGQLAVVAAVLGGGTLARRWWPAAVPARRFAAYVIGVAGAFWFLERVVALAS
jgi:hydrogenase/urease accessory protein HupE